MPSPTLSPRCPIRTTLDLVGGKWQLLILARLGSETVGFADLRGRLPGISDKVLAATLSRLAEDLLLERTEAGYRRTAAGAAVEPLLGAMVEFAGAYGNLVGIAATAE